MIIDTHAHLCDPIFTKDFEEVMHRAEKIGIERIIAVGENLADAQMNILLASRYRIVSAAAGLFPTYLDMERAEEIISFIRKHRAELAAIGEVGLDYWKVKSDKEREIQRTIFANFIDLSLELDLPLNVHSRAAGKHVITMLIEKGAKKVQLHAFDGKASNALSAVEEGYFFSIPPSITYSRQKQKLVKRLPLSVILVETDSPVLGPESGERNEPSNANIVIETIANIKSKKTQEVMKKIYENTFRLYDL